MVKIEKLAVDQRLVNENTKEGYLITAITPKKRFITVDKITNCSQQNEPLRLSSSEFLKKFKDFKVHKVAEEEIEGCCNGCSLKIDRNSDDGLCGLVPYCHDIILKEVN